MRASFLQKTKSWSQFGALQRKKVLCWRDCQVQMQVSMSHVTDHDVTMMVRSGYMMAGSPVSWCQADGSWAPQWSQVSCLRYLQVFFLNLEKVFPNSRSCTYPGAVIHGTINPVMFYYKVSQTVTYKCSEVIMTSV